VKRLTVLGLIALVLTTTLLIGAGGIGGNDSYIGSGGAGIMAVVNKVWGNSEEIYFGEMAYGSERYLMVMNSNCDGAISSNVTETISLAVNPGPGKYAVIGYRTLGDDQDTLIDTVSIDGIHYLDTISFALTRGGSILLHFDPITPDTAYAPLYVDDTTATYYVNGRKIAVDRFGRIHVCYSDLSGSTHSVWYARSDNACTTWQKQKITNNVFCPAIAVDTFGIPWVTYMSYPDMHKICVWSEGFYDTLVSSSELISNAPCIALDFEQGVGMIFYSSRGVTYSMALELPSLKPPSHWYRPPKGNYSRAWPLSCCFSEAGDAVATGSGSFFGQHEGELYRRIEKHPGTLYEMKNGFSTGWHGNPSTARQGSKVWAAYYQGSSNTIRYKKASRSSDGDYLFPGGRGDSITCPAGNYKANSVQLADDFPFVVWSQSSPDGSWRKIYYNYMKTNQTWSERIRLSSTNAYQLERYPHVDFDYNNKKIYIMWTQFPRPGYSGDTLINFKTLTFEDIGWDSVWLKKPNGPPSWWELKNKSGLPPYMVGVPMDFEWTLKTESNPCSSRVYMNYDYPGNGTWEHIGSAPGNDSDLVWTPEKGGDSCRAKVEVWYPGNNRPYDISDECFEIIHLHVHGNGNAYFPGGLSLVYKPSNTVQVTTWDVYGFHGLDTVDLQISKDYGETFSSIGDSSTYDSTVIDTVYPENDTLYGYHYSGITYWTTPTEPTSGACMRLMAVDTVPDTAYSDLFDSFNIPPADGFTYSTYSNQNMISPNDDGDKIGFVYTGQDPDTATKVSVLYMESDEGLDFSAPDTIAEGCWPAFSAGACCWQTKTGDTLRYGYQSGDSFVVSTLHAIPQAYANGQFTPVGILSENDTVHMIFRESGAYVDDRQQDCSTIKLIHLKFLETSPANLVALDTIIDSTVTTGYSLYDTTKVASDLVKRDSIIYAAYDALDKCFFTTITSSNFVITLMVNGSHPQIALSEGNITYTYLGAGDTTLIRLWRYVDDTTWVERDTFYLNKDAEFLFGEQGLYYGVQYADTNLADIFVYDPISEEYYLNASYTGYYPHPYIDTGGEEFAWISVYADYVDTSTTYMHTERHDINVILPALYLETDDKRSPYTVFRDTCIHYRSVDVDSGRDSLTYLFGNLNSSDDYSVIVEFYTECDSVTQLQVQVGTNLDTIQIPGNSYSWYEQDIASSSDTMVLVIRRLSQFGFVPVSRVIVRRRSEAGFFMAMGGQQSDGPIVIPFCLYQPFPNPFGDAATIRYSLPYATHVSLKVYDVSGRMVTRLVDGQVDPGVHELRWEGKDNLNRKCPSGVYFVRYQADEYQAAKKMVLIK